MGHSCMNVSYYQRDIPVPSWLSSVMRRDATEFYGTIQFTIKSLILGYWLRRVTQYLGQQAVTSCSTMLSTLLFPMLKPRLKYGMIQFMPVPSQLPSMD